MANTLTKLRMFLRKSKPIRFSANDCERMECFGYSRAYSWKTFGTATLCHTLFSLMSPTENSIANCISEAQIFSLVFRLTLLRMPFLTFMMAQCANVEPGDFIHTFEMFIFIEIILIKSIFNSLVNQKHFHR